MTIVGEPKGADRRAWEGSAQMAEIRISTRRIYVGRRSGNRCDSPGKIARRAPQERLRPSPGLGAELNDRSSLEHEIAPVRHSPNPAPPLAKPNRGCDPEGAQSLRKHRGC